MLGAAAHTSLFQVERTSLPSICTVLLDTGDGVDAAQLIPRIRWIPSGCNGVNRYLFADVLVKNGQGEETRSWSEQDG